MQSLLCRKKNQNLLFLEAKDEYELDRIPLFRRKMNKIQVRSYFFRGENNYGSGHLFNHKRNSNLFCQKKMTMCRLRDEFSVKIGQNLDWD